MSKRKSPKATKRALCDILEVLSKESAPPDEHRRRVLPVLWQHAKALTEERAQGLPPSARDEIVSTAGERVTVALQRLDLSAPPAQQATFLDAQLHHALADAGRASDPLGRGPRTLRRRYEATCEALAQAHGAMPALAERQEVLDELVGPDKPVLRLLVGQGMSPDVAVAYVDNTVRAVADDPCEIVSKQAVRRQLAKAIADHPDREVRQFLFSVAAGISTRQPRNFYSRLGPALPQVIGSLLLEEPCG